MSRIICALSAAVAVVFSSFALAEEDSIRMVANPPDRHVVVKGDTLWGIAGKFLQEPWRWPEIWRLNQSQIRNPHLIYPGDVVLLDYADGSPRLRLGKPVGQDNKVQPAVHIEQIAQAIPSIPANVIEPFITRPLIVSQHDLEDSPYVIGMDESRVLAGYGDEIYAKGIEDNHSRWYIYRQGAPLRRPAVVEKDALGTPENEGMQPSAQENPLLRNTRTDGWPTLAWREEADDVRILGYEAIYVGLAELKEPGDDVSVLEILSAKEEIMQGDRLIPAERPTLHSYIPRKMDDDVNGQLVSFYGGVNSGGKFSVISMSLGEQDGIEPGHVLGLYVNRAVRYRDPKGRSTVTAVPEKRNGLVFVFRVFDRISYGLVMEAARPLQIGDVVRNP
ncbi:MAG: LysM peptidoglycan-binding domain-containing protein [Betaproteobacteria bacterium]|nr:LysM peptidoglycan-binding domain-containing protein [Betaproteobacteria bacterium]